MATNVRACSLTIAKTTAIIALDMTCTLAQKGLVIRSTTVAFFPKLCSSITLCPNPLPPQPKLYFSLVPFFDPHYDAPDEPQLKEELKNGKAFDGWLEGVISFPPTYKYEINSDRYVGDDPNAGRRTPAWAKYSSCWL
ncbi:hypothetical protein HPP92_009777 [Vanilla planifolia]|uniref:Inositol polyphosphate-related phosphatase domain-containing protein n=1 Tax=Vanilla planifolia TaxID=51239 RepID=A0A835R8J2_VANPL|nr:hypothetical protein HPP92_009777 [Vanilla planifolia]